MKTSDQRVIYGRELLALAETHPDIVVLEADLGKSTMTYDFQQQYPHRYFEMGIAEANMTGYAAGLALTGCTPFTNSFAVFAAGRAYDQIRQGIAIGALNVKVVGSSAGLSDFGDGATHQSVEDIAIMRAIPQMTVLVPADGPQVRDMMRHMLAHPGPAYLRLSRNSLPEVTTSGGIAPTVLRNGTDVALVACGIMVHRAIQAADALSAEGISARVVNVPCVKPLDAQALMTCVAGISSAVTCEEHSVIGGLSQTVAWALRGSGIALEAVAVEDQFGQSAPSADALYAHYHLCWEDIAHKARVLAGHA